MVAHRMLRAIDQHSTMEKVAAKDLCYADEFIRPRSELSRQFATQPDLLVRAELIANQCICDWHRGLAVNKQHFTNNHYADRKLLRNLAHQGLAQRYPGREAAAKVRVDQELKLIEQLNFETYYLITWDIVQFAQRNHYQHVGRGSGANSVVAYCLGITNVDPIALNLYFERFINPYRPEPPDFDIDFSWDERDEVITYVRERHGKEQVGLLCSYQTFKGKSTVRELGKVLGLQKKEIELILREPLAQKKHHPAASQIFKHGKRILGLPSHLSMHSGGIIISDYPLASIAASQMMPKGFSVVQIDKEHASYWGLHKFDLLSQRGIGHIKEAAALVREVRNVDVDLYDMAAIVEDRETLALIRRPGACIGCFYIESPAMRGLLSKVACRTYEDLVAVSSIIRPGVAKSGMMKAYIERFRNQPERKASSLPHLEELLPDTFGIMVYQEDVMKVVHQVGGFDLFQADLLRRLMTGKSKSVADLQRLEALFFENCQIAKMESPTIREIWRQIASFSGYAFCKAHSATYAAESLQSAYLKAHFPVEFLVSVINNQGGFYDTGVYVRELQKTGTQVELPCINNSSWLTRVIDEKVYLGFSSIKGLQLSTGQALLKLRRRYGVIKTLDQMIALIAPKQIDLLIELGACRTINKSRQSLFFNRLVLQPDRSPRQLNLFNLPAYPFNVEEKEDDLQAQGLIELRLLGFTLASPFLLVAELPANVILQSDMLSHMGKEVWMLGHYIIEKSVTTQDGQHMCFVTWTDQEHAYFDSVHFVAALEKYPVDGKGLYLLEGKIAVEWGYPSLIVSKVTCLQRFRGLLQKDLLVEDVGPFLSS
jgi:DNA polymerase-3 subunit alpha